MENLDHLRQTLEHYKQQRQKKLDELRAVELMIQQLQTDLGDPPSFADLLGQDILPTTSTIVSPTKTNMIGVRPDEFFGMSQSDAAKAYLRKIGRAIPFSELVTALQNGGAKLGGADPSKTLYVSLARNPKKEFVWPSSDHISLGEFYTKRDSA